MIKTYYQQLKPIVLKSVFHYLDDFKVYDKKALHRYNGTFLYALRETGTDIFLIDKPAYTKEQIESGKTWLCSYNKKFFIGKNNQITEISKEECIKQFDNIKIRGVSE